MEYNLKPNGTKHTNEPADKYGVHFEYQDLYQRLTVLKKQREKTQKTCIFKSFDKDSRKNTFSGIRLKHKSKCSLRSNSIIKKSNRGTSIELMKITKIYSPCIKKIVHSPERFLGSVRFNKSLVGAALPKRKISKGRVYIT